MTDPTYRYISQIYKKFGSPGQKVAHTTHPSNLCVLVCSRTTPVIGPCNNELKSSLALEKERVILLLDLADIL